VRAYVLAGGLGTRLRDRLGALPKVLAPFGERPFLDTQLEWLAECGVNEVTLALGVRSEPVIDRVRVRSAEALPIVRWTVDPVPLGTGGALAYAAREEARTFLVVNGDTLAELDLVALLELHQKRGALVTLATYRVSDAKARGTVEMESDGRVTAFREKEKSGEAWVSGGIYFCEPAILGMIPRGKPSGLETDLFPKIVAEGLPLYALRSSGKLYDIGTPAGLDQAQREWPAILAKKEKDA
jgi:NDP-sugar pyrophosphorylase family protein